VTRPELIIAPHWEVDIVSEPGLLKVRLHGRLTVEEMTAFVAAHNAAIDALNGADYKVFCDIREMLPLSPACAELMGKAKSYSRSKRNCRGSAVWVSSAIVTMQHARTSKQSGVLNTELLSTDEAALRAHLKTVWRDG
jgi:hypothetical protein